jgi:hypothetical protein
MANNTLIGAIRAEASLDGGKFVDGAKKIKLAAKDTEAGVKKSFGGMQKSIGGSLGALKAGAAGFVAALSVGMFTQVIGNALKYAASLKTVSERLGVTTKDLQTLRYAAQQNGIANEVLDNGLEKLAITLGKVAAGATAPTKALQAIGITADQLKGKDTGQALRIIADGLANIGDRSQRAAVEVALFGETGAKLDALLSKGAGGINELAAAAEELGIILSDEQIQKADETAKKLEAMKTVLQARIAGVVSDNADAILGLAEALANVANAVAQVIGVIVRLANAIASLPPPPAWIAGLAGGFNPALGALYGNTQPGRSATMKLPPARKAGGGGTANIGQFLAPKAGGGRKARTPRAPKDTSLRDAFQFDQEIRRAQMDVLRATQSLSRNYIDRGEIAIELLNLEKSAFEAELKYEVAAKEKTQAQADQLLAEYNKKDALERQAILLDREEQRYEDSARLDDLTFDLERDRLESEAQLADSAKEERAIRLRLLDLAYRQERARLETILADESASIAAKEDARRRLANLNQTEGNDRQAVINSTRGPMEEWSHQFGDIGDELEDLKVRGIMGAVDALSHLTEGWDSFADAAKSAISQVLAELIRLQLMKMAVQLFGSATGAPTGAVPSGAGLPGLAGGGSIFIRGNPGLDKNILSLNGIPMARVDYGERIDVSNDNGSRRGMDGLTVHAPITINGNVDRKTLAQVESSVRRAVGNAGRRGTA